MGRAKRAAEGGLIYHVLNRANGRMKIFDDAVDYEAFERILSEAVARTGTDVLAFCFYAKSLAPGRQATRRR